MACLPENVVESSKKTVSIVISIGLMFEIIIEINFKAVFTKLDLHFFLKKVSKGKQVGKEMEPKGINLHKETEFLPKGKGYLAYLERSRDPACFSARNL